MAQAHVSTEAEKGKGSLAGRRRAIVIDDDPVIRNMVAEILTAEGFDVSEAEDGRRGLALLKADRKVDLIVTDILMPTQDGFGFLLEARNFYQGAADQPKIIAITGGGWYQATKFYLDQAAIFGAHVTLAKPFTLEELLAAIESLGLKTGSEPAAAQ